MQKMSPQLKLVIVLNFVIVILVVGLFIVYEFPSEKQPQSYVSSMPDIYTSWQLEMTQKNENAVSSFVAPDGKTLHIVGNCKGNSDDEVFFASVKEGSVVKKTTLDLKTPLAEKNNAIYGFSLKKACISENGYMLALQGYMNTSSGKIDVSFVASIDYEGNVINVDVHNVISPERIADAFYSDGNIYMVVQTGFNELNINNIKIYRYSKDVVLQNTLSADHLGNMEYLFMSDYREGYLLCFNVTSLSYKCAAFAYIIPGTNATFEYAEMSVGYKALDFTVIPNGYAMLCLDDNGESFLLKLSSDFKITSSSYYPSGGEKKTGKILFTDRGYMIHSGAADKFYLYDDNLDSSSELPECDCLCDAVESRTITIAAAIYKNKIRLYIFDNALKVIDLETEGERTSATLLRLSDGPVIVTNGIKDDRASCLVIKLNSDSVVTNT